MRKKFLAVVLSLTMAVSMMAGCGSSQEDYEDDIEAFEDIADLEFPDFDFDDEDDMKDAVEEFKKDLEDIKFSTKEGKAVKKVFVSLASELETFTKKALKAYEDEDEDEMEELLEDYEKKMEDIYDDLEDAMEDFIDAAEDAGVDEDDLEDLGF